MKRSIHAGIGPDRGREYIRLSALILLAAIRGNVEGQTFKAGPFVELYSEAGLDTVACVTKTVFKHPMRIDAPLALVRNWRSRTPQQLVFWTSPWGYSWYAGGSVEGGNIFARMVSQKEAFDKSPLPQMWQGVTDEASLVAHLGRNYAGSTCTNRCDSITKAAGFIANLYRIDTPTVIESPAAHFLGFTHLERSNLDWSAPGNANADRRYAIGLAYSADNGATWKYAGDAIRPAYDAIGDVPAGSASPYLSNISGIPYVVVREGGSDFFYLYYTEHVDARSRGYTAVARVKVADAIAQAQRGSIDRTRWKKLGSSGSWDQDGLTGTGRPLLPWTRGDLNIAHYDVHSDAAYCAPLGKYFLLAHKVEWEGAGHGARLWRRLVLMTSTDAVSWVGGQVIDESHGTYTSNPADMAAPYNPYYPSFYSADSAASDDFSTIGRNFTVLYMRQRKIRKTPTTAEYSLAGDLYMRSFTAIP